MSRTPSDAVGSTNPIVLRPTRLHWIQDKGDDPADLCAHSPVEFTVRGVPLGRPEEGDWTVSAAGLFLLHTLTRDHTREARVSGQLFPCCGMDYYLAGTTPETVLIPHCPSGADCWIEHHGDDVHLHTDASPVQVVSKTEWRDAVFAFCDEVLAFYERSQPKVPFDAQRALEYVTFVAEWDRLRQQPVTTQP